MPIEYPYHGIWFYVDIDNWQTYTVNMMSDLPKQGFRKFIVDIYTFKEIGGPKKDWHPLRSFYITNDNLCSFVGTVEDEAQGPITITVTEWE